MFEEGPMATVLVVDDEPQIRRLVVRLLAGTAYEVVAEAADGNAAVSAWREHEPDVVILDHMMPGRSGLDAAASMLAERPEQLIVLFTAFADRNLFERARGLGVAACIAKTDVMTLPDVLDDAGRDRAVP